MAGRGVELVWSVVVCVFKNLAQHKRTNLEEKPYHCNICGKSFYRIRNFTTHTRVHRGKRPYHCDIIGESFSVA
ncbi:---NA--- [Octopus vulgaris]|uniref:---NA n=1 Tax=Octopus vulgaris TaxID=6645 RepID=A0AA36BYE0_OCTVU|nr:---NA--- [Octopus vulgaris]